ncbi:hypothetical protein [Robertkochia aurantiaca]|uniref:hypothetical protein n=1 Tax=Robertkochia aurantiaca TaxID=2873700 RepID=UPI001CCF3F2C|nr:hypothetical protein [Robertkochia sp. 3YJGBD-33]
MSKPAKCISKARAAEEQNNFVNDNRFRALFKNKVREFWWSLEEIEEYIAYLRKEAGTQGYDNLGLRFYLGKSSADTGKDDVTLFITGTGQPNTELQGQPSREDDNLTSIDAYNVTGTGVPPKDY